MLGTALLAKATDDRVGALTLRASSGHNGYSARSLAKDVLVPLCVREGINLRTTGPEPLNNQPFLRDAVVSREMNVHDAERPALFRLVESLEAADFLRGEDAVLAFAAFLRARIDDPTAAAAQLRKIATDGGSWPYGDVATFISRRTDGGRRGQALVAAGLDLVHGRVRIGRVNDPSRKFPGDVHVGSGTPTLAVEVRQKLVREHDVDQFVARCAGKRIRRAAVAAFAPAQEPLDDEQLMTRAKELHSVQLDIWYTPLEFLRTCAMFSARSAEESWGTFAERMLRRLEELEAPEDTIDEWVQLVEAGAE
jgi:hypothetical protein